MRATSVHFRLRLPPRHRKRGFTLVEVLFAAAASAMIFVVIFGIFTTAMHLRDKATTLTLRARQRARAEAIIRNDLRNAFISGADPTTTNAIAAVLNGTQQSHGTQFPGYLQFTATTAQLSDDQPGGEVQAIEYYVAKDPNSADSKSGLLVRTETRLLLATTPVQPVEEPILPGVASLNISFYDGNEWQDSWSYAEAGDPLPEAIRVDVGLAPPDARSGPPPPIEIIVPWEITPFIPVPPTSTTGTGGAATGS